MSLKSTRLLSWVIIQYTACFENIWYVSLLNVWAYSATHIHNAALFINRKFTWHNTHQCYLSDTDLGSFETFQDFMSAVYIGWRASLQKKALIDVFPGDLGKSRCYHQYCFWYHLHPLPQPVKTGVFIGLEGLKQEIKHLHSIFHQVPKDWDSKDFDMFPGIT